MEGLRHLARSSFAGQASAPPLSAFEVINIASFQTNPISYTLLRMKDEDLAQAMSRSDHQQDDADATFQLVNIRREDTETLPCSPNTFLTIFEAFGIETYILYLIRSNCYVFHTFPVDKSPNGNASYSFFVGTVLYSLIWSFDPKTIATRVILIPRRSNGLRNGEATFHEFGQILQLYQTHISSPCLPAFVACIHIIQFVDEFIAVELLEIRKMEINTGHGPWNNPLVSAAGLEPTTLTNWSGQVGAWLVNLANQLRHEDIAASLISFILERNNHIWTKDIHENYLTRHDASVEMFISVAPMLQNQVANGKAYVNYLQERARSQLTLFGLLTHENASASISLTNSSKELSEAAKKDSSAMKTIAVMTMAFLPGTFFVALFAVPPLKWDESNVIQDNFWIYWAFTLPSTALVFLVWFSVMKRKTLLDNASQALRWAFRHRR